MSEVLDSSRFNVTNKLLPFMSERSRYKVAYGGRGGAKSWSIARMLVLVAYGNKDELILCTREFQTSIGDSVHALIRNQIEMMGLSPWFHITENEITCLITRSRFIFKGLRRNIGEIKSTEGVTRCWVEEAQAVSKESWRTLIPTIRYPGSEIWVSYNPNKDDDPTHERFVIKLADYVRGRALVVKVNWNDNPWFPPDLEEERLHDLRTDPDAYDWIWQGNTRHVSEATIFRNRFVVETFEAPDTQRRFLFGADWGFANDPTVLIRCWEDNRGPGRLKLMIDYEAYGIGVEMDDLPALFRGGIANKNGAIYPGIPGAEDHPIKGDNSRPETISYVRRQGLNVMAAKKWPGCVEDGVSYLKAYDQIVIHPRCVHMAQEARLYSYKVDKRTEDILPEIEGKHDHCWDAVRYSLDGYITAKGALGTWQKLGNK